MQLVNLCPGISVRPDQVQLVIAQKNPDKVVGGYITNVSSAHSITVGLWFDTATEAEQCAIDWTAKINGTTVGPMVPNQDLDAKARLITDAVAGVMDGWEEIAAVTGLWDGDLHDLFLDEIKLAVREQLGGTE